MNEKMLNREMHTRTVLSAYSLEHAYESADHSDETVLHEVSFELEAGSVTALLGPNASGKSTLMRLLAGVIQPSEGGFVQVRSSRLSSLPARDRALLVSYSGADLYSEFPITVLEAIEMGRVSAVAQGLETQESLEVRVRQAMQEVGCYALRNRVLSSLSGGERQRVLLARTLVQGARVMLFDESFSKMDLHHQAEAARLLRGKAKELGLAILWVSHDLAFMKKWSDGFLILKQGRLHSTSAAPTLTDEMLNEVYPGM